MFPFLKFVMIQLIGINARAISSGFGSSVGLVSQLLIGIVSNWMLIP